MSITSKFPASRERALFSIKQIGEMWRELSTPGSVHIDSDGNHWANYDDKYLVLHSRKSPTKQKNYGNVVIYPKPEHLATFNSFNEHLEPQGTSDYFPGSIGAINYRIIITPMQKTYSGKTQVENKDQYHVRYIQGNYLHNKAKEQNVKKTLDAYMGWRSAGFKRLIQIARAFNGEILLDFNVLKNKKPSSQFKIIHDLKRAVKQEPATITKTHSEEHPVLIISPNHVNKE